MCSHYEYINFYFFFHLFCLFYLLACRISIIRCVFFGFGVWKRVYACIHFDVAAQCMCCVCVARDMNYVVETSQAVCLIQYFTLGHKTFLGEHKSIESDMFVNYIARQRVRVEYFLFVCLFLCTGILCFIFLYHLAGYCFKWTVLTSIECGGIEMETKKPVHFVGIQAFCA